MSQSEDIKAAARRALAPIAEDMLEVERIIMREVSSAVSRVDEVGHYITAAGGKRMRPALLILMARAMGADPAKAAYLGAVIEILHTATLMHDDVVDEGKMRRGRETANARWGNGTAVLVGDFFYTRSFQMMVRAGNLKVMQALADAANRLSEGEVLQMNNAHNPDITEADYFGVIERKTACLFKAAAHMAAAIADLGRVRRDSLVQDPFCGSGTLVIEAAQKALNLAPGLRRRFAAEHFDFVPADLWAEQRQKALEEVRKDAAFEGIGYDIDPAAVALANANAKLAGVGDRCRFEVADVRDFRALDNAVVLTNPPYGERLGDASEAASLARTLGQVWQAHPAQGLYAITADADFEQHFGKKAARRRKIYNGMIPCQLYMYFEQPKRERK
jgi:16S rRNA G966 N2-methylase RsmD